MSLQTKYWRGNVWQLRDEKSPYWVIIKNEDNHAIMTDGFTQRKVLAGSLNRYFKHMGKTNVIPDYLTQMHSD